MSFLWTKKPPFDKTTWSIDKTKVSWTGKWAQEILGTDAQNHGLTRFKICKFLDYSKMSFLWTKNPLFVKKNIMKGQNQSFLYRKIGSQDIFGTYDQNHGLTRFKISKFFHYRKISFLWTKKPPFDKKHDQTTKRRSLVQKSRLQRYLELMTRIMG